LRKWWGGWFQFDQLIPEVSTSDGIDYFDEIELVFCPFVDYIEFPFQLVRFNLKGILPA